MFDRLSDTPGTFGVAHYHPRFEGTEPGARVWDAQLSADPWLWLEQQFACVGAEGGKDPWPMHSADAAELRRLGSSIVGLARQLGPDRCSSSAQCHELTRDVAGTVRLMVKYLRGPELLDKSWTYPWLQSTTQDEASAPSGSGS